MISGPFDLLHRLGRPGRVDSSHMAHLVSSISATLAAARCSGTPSSSAPVNSTPGDLPSGRNYASPQSGELCREGLCPIERGVSALGGEKVQIEALLPSDRSPRLRQGEVPPG
jgi:hypothetical protein